MSTAARDAPRFELRKVERHRGEDRMMVPAGITATLEVIEPQLGLEVAILHFERLRAPRDADERLERRVRRQVAQVVLPVAVDQRFLTKQPVVSALDDLIDAVASKAF
jgi:hypothetical protein